MTAKDAGLSVEAARGRAALAARGVPPAPDAGFRERLRRDFVAGTIAGSPPGMPRPRRTVVAAWPWAAAAAVVMAVAIGLATNASPPWHVERATGAGAVIVDGRRIALQDTHALGAALAVGAHVEIPTGGELVIASERVAAIEMEHGTVAVVPRVPGRWFGRSVNAWIERGEWRISTGPGFAGAHLAIRTPMAHVEVTGTTLAVICDAHGTCVCVYEGHVRVGRGPADLQLVGPKRRRYVYADTTLECLNDAMLPQELPALGRFRDSLRGPLHLR